jgi:hypothetical protein
MLVDNGAAVNLMPYLVFKKLGREYDEIMKTNLTLNGMGGNPMEARCIVSVEFTIGRMPLATTFFIVVVQGNYSVILGHNWIHANRCISSTLHQFHIQWINDENEVVHADASAYITLTDATTDWQHGSAQCLSEKDLIGYGFLSVTKDEFVPMSVQPTSESRLSDVIFQ